jgi:hypothetical protein
MFLSRMVLCRLPALGGLAVAAAALLLAAGPASAQPPGYGSPPSGASKMWPWNVGYPSPPAAAARPAAPVTPPASYRAPAGLPPHWDGTLLVTVTRAVPAQAVAATAAPRPAALTVSLRGPDGVVRSYPVEGGRASIQPSQEIIVRPGTSATINATAARPK